MSWGTNYKYDGFISRVGIKELENELEETRKLLDGTRQQMLALMAMSPPESRIVEDENGDKIPWNQYVVSEMERLWEGMMEYMCLSVRLQQAIEVKEFEPENITEG